MNPRPVIDFEFLRTRWKILALFNALFFSCIFVTLVLSSFFLQPQLDLGWRPNVPEYFLNSGWPVMILGIFVFNLALSSFVFVTLPGIVFFPLSAGFLSYRGFLWGLLLYTSPTLLFIASLPTIILEGEAYVLAAMAGSVVGASWIKPCLAYQESRLSRLEAFKKSLKECLKIYAVVAVLLFVAATVETMTILLFV